MKHLNDQAFGDSLKKKLSQINTDIPTPEWDTIENRLIRDEFTWSYKLISVSIILSLMLLFPVPLHNRSIALTATPILVTQELVDQLEPEEGLTKETEPLQPRSEKAKQPDVAVQEFVNENAGTMFRIDQSEDPKPHHLRWDLVLLPPILSSRSGEFTTDLPRPGLMMDLPFTALPMTSGTAKSNFAPKSIGIFSQLAFHTLRPLKKDENNIGSSPDKSGFVDRWGVRIQANYELEFLRLKWHIGPLLNYYQTQLNYEITNDQGPGGSIVNKRLDGGFYVSMMLKMEKLKLPGSVFGGFSWQRLLSGTHDLTTTYPKSLNQYEVGYMYPLTPKQGISLMYRSFLKDQAIENLGHLRPHVYSIGYQWSF